jgi:hypothetical protein
MPRVDGAASGGGGWRVPGVYAALLEREWERCNRPDPLLLFGTLVQDPKVYRRSRHMLDALEAGQAVTVPSWRLGGHGVPIPRELKCWPNRFVVSPDDTVVLS